jgi:hypothetical protein
MRREAATNRILSQRCSLPELITYFDEVGDTELREYGAAPRGEWLKEQYGLNNPQIEAFRQLWAYGPVGLLQGPPGTGKTKFIAAFVHYALTTGCLRNVLLASQSHEAVNNATEEILRLFRSANMTPSLVRVGHEGFISDPLVPFHTAHVEALYREKFRARIKENYALAGWKLGLPSSFTEMFFGAATSLRPVLRQIAALRAEEERSNPEIDARVRITTLQETAERIALSLGISKLPPEPDEPDDDKWFDAVVEILRKKHAVINREHVRRLRQIMKLSDDWLGHVGTRRRNFEEFLVSTRQIVAGTCVGLGRSSLGLAETTFDLVVVDEAARCTPSELAVPLQSGKRVLLVGDHRQLEPFHDREVINATAERLNIEGEVIRRSDFERAFSSSYGKVHGRTLTVQYRMIPPIGRLISETFYNGEIGSGRNELTGPVPTCLPTPITWIETSDVENPRESKTSKGRTTLQNNVEADEIVRLLTEMEADVDFYQSLVTQSEDGSKPIGVICAYAGQKELLNRKAAAAGLSASFRSKVKIDTIDSYQGKQNQIVIVSLVRNNASGTRGQIRQGFLSRPNRVNVALSRAMDRLVIVGTAQGWPSGSPLCRVATLAKTMANEGSVAFRNAGAGEGRHERHTQAKTA